MCLSWKCVFSIMSLKNRRFSLDSSVNLDGAGLLGPRRGSNGKKSRQTVDEARQEIQELNQSLNANISLREQTIAEESLDRSDGLITSNKEVLYHGKLYLSENHLCFYSSVLLKDTKVVILRSSIQNVKKHNSALSKLSVQTADGDKYSFVSLRNREMCYRRLQPAPSPIQNGSANSSPRPSSAENEADQEVLSSHSSFEDSVDHRLSRMNSIDLDNSFQQLSSEAPTRCNSALPSSPTNEDNRGVSVSWIWRITERVAPFFFLQEISNLSVLFHIYVMLMVLLLLVSGYIGLRIIALEERLNSLGAMTELSLQHRDFQQT